MSTPETATLNSGTMATITAAARTVYPYDASLGDVYGPCLAAAVRRQPG